MKKLLMVLALLPLMAAAENFRFEYIDNDDGTVMLTGVSGTVPSTLKVPAQIEGRNVSAVGYGFMSKNQKVSSIVISEGVCRIGEKAFCDCHSLESIEIPKSVIEIGDKAFASSRAAVSGQTTGGVSSLVVSPDNEFFEVVSGVLIDRKEGRAIVACANVRSVSLPDGVTTICDMAFCGCTELKTIQFPVSLMTIEGDKNFGACFSLENVDFHETSLVEVGEQAFALCKNLKTACFPSTLERIGSYAFSWCNALTSVQFVGREPIVVQVDKSDPMFPFGDIYVTSDSLDMSSNGAGPFTKHLDRVITYVLPDMGWENAVAKGEWQGRPIRYIGMSPQVGSLEVIPGEAVSVDTGLIGYTAKGLPSGLKYDKKTGKITGAATKPTAAEGATVKFTKKGEADEEMIIVVEKERMSVGCAGLECRSFTVGVAGGAGIPLEIETQSGVKSVKVTKLPAGMKYNAKTGLIEGAPTKAGDFTVQIAVTAKSGAVEKKDIAIHVDPLPDWAVGTFEGAVRQIDYDADGNVVSDGEGLHDWYDVVATVSVDAKGKISGKLTFPDKKTLAVKLNALTTVESGVCIAEGDVMVKKQRYAVRAAFGAGSFQFADGVVNMGRCDLSIILQGQPTTCFRTDADRPLVQTFWSRKELKGLALQMGLTAKSGFDVENATGEDSEFSGVVKVSDGGVAKLSCTVNGTKSTANGTLLPVGQDLADGFAAYVSIKISRTSFRAVKLLFVPTAEGWVVRAVRWQ